MVQVLDQQNKEEKQARFLVVPGGAGHEDVTVRVLDSDDVLLDTEALGPDEVRALIGQGAWIVVAPTDSKGLLEQLSPNPPMRSGLGVGTRGEGRGTRRSALDSDKWGRWRPLVGVGGADGGPGQRRWGGVGGTACKGRQSRTGPVRLCGVVE